MIVLSYMAPAGQKAPEIQMTVSLKDIKGKSQGGAADAYSVEPIPGQWRKAVRSFVVPNQVGASKAATATFVPVTNFMEPEDEIYYDDIRVYRLPD